MDGKSVRPRVGYEWFWLLAFSAVSVWANALHAGPGDRVGWVLSGVVPISGAVVLHVLTRSIDDELGWPLTVGLAVVASASIVLSWNALTDMAEAHGLRPAWLFPVIVDGAAATIAGAIWQRRRKHSRKPERQHDSEARKPPAAGPWEDVPADQGVSTSAVVAETPETPAASSPEAGAGPAAEAEVEELPEAEVVPMRKGQRWSRDQVEAVMAERKAATGRPITERRARQILAERAGQATG